MAGFFAYFLCFCLVLFIHGQQVDEDDETCLSTQNLKVVMNSSPQLVLRGKEAADFEVYNCQETALADPGGFFTLSEAPNAVTNTPCLALFKPEPRGLGGQKISVLIWNEIGNGIANYGHTGIVYNAKDPDNYDLVYVRPQSTGSCYQTTYFRNGKYHQVASSACLGGPPAGRKWFILEVFVEINRAVVYLDGLFVVETRPRFSHGGRVGVMMWNGYQNEIHFKDLTITGADFAVYNCKQKSLEDPYGYFTLSEPPKAVGDSHCLALFKPQPFGLGG